MYVFLVDCQQQGCMDEFFPLLLVFDISDVTIIESKIEIDFFLKIKLNRNRLFGWYFFDFDSRLYWRRQRTAASSKHDS